MVSRKLNVFDRMVVLNLGLLVLAMVVQAVQVVHQAGRSSPGWTLVTQVLAAVALVLFVVQSLKTLGSITHWLQTPILVLATHDSQDLNVRRAAHWLQRGKTLDDVEQVFGTPTALAAHRLNTTDRS